MLSTVLNQIEPTQFELNPLISEIVLWNDAEILDRQPEFAKFDFAARFAQICGELFFHNVAVVEFLPKPVWLPTSILEDECGGSSIVPRSRYLLRGGLSLGDQRNHEKAVKKQLQRRLEFIVKKSALMFQNYNAGFVKISGRDDIGMLRWDLTAEGAKACN